MGPKDEEPEELPEDLEEEQKRRTLEAAKISNYEELPEDLEEAKKRRTLEKKLRQIQDIEERQRQGQTLNPDQLAKLSRKADVEVELRALSTIGTDTAEPPASPDAAEIAAKVAQLAALAKKGKNAELEVELRRLLCQS